MDNPQDGVREKVAKALRKNPDELTFEQILDFFRKKLKTSPPVYKV
jgi:Fe2+ or Zn2+ uptake regulation protein